MSDVEKKSEGEKQNLEENMSDKDKLVESENEKSSKVEEDDETETTSKQKVHKEKSSKKDKVKKDSTSKQKYGKDPPSKEEAGKADSSANQDTGKYDETSIDENKKESTSKGKVDRKDSSSKQDTVKDDTISKDANKKEKTSKEKADRKDSSSKQDVGEDSSTEPFGDGPSEENKKKSEAADGESRKNVGDESDEDTESSKSESSGEKSDDLQEQKKEQEEFRKNQEALMKTVIDREKELAQLPQLIPCNSCEFLEDPKDSEISFCCWGRFRNPCVTKRISIFWIVSVPADPTPQEAFDKLNESTAPNKLSINYKLHLPNLKVGSLNDLISLTASLSKLDTDGERIVENLVDFMKTIIKGDLRKFLEDNNLDVINYITRFTWNSVKYPDTRPLPVLKDIIRSKLRNMEDNIKARADEYASLDKELENIEKQKSGSLINRSLADIVHKEDFVLGSRLFTTLVVVVPNTSEKEWWNGYRKLAEAVIPDSSKELYSDKEHKLFSVVVGKKCVDEFKANATKERFIVRDFEYNEEKMAEEKEVQENVENLRKDNIKVLIRWLKVNFSETFAAWIHVKVMRCFVESVLKYGIKSGFQTVVLIPLKPKLLKKKLDVMYDHVDTDFCVGNIKDAPGGLDILGGRIENTKYVYFTIPIPFISSKGKT